MTCLSGSIFQDTCRKGVSKHDLLREGLPPMLGIEHRVPRERVSRSTHTTFFEFLKKSKTFNFRSLSPRICLLHRRTKDLLVCSECTSTFQNMFESIFANLSFWGKNRNQILGGNAFVGLFLKTWKIWNLGFINGVGSSIIKGGTPFWLDFCTRTHQKREHIWRGRQNACL